MSDDPLDELAEANRAKQVGTYRRPPPPVVFVDQQQRTKKSYSPFQWGCGVVLGVLFGVLLIFILLAFLSGFFEGLAKSHP